MAKFETFEQVEDAVGVLAAGHLELEARVKKQDEKIAAQDEKIRLLVAMADLHHQLFVDHGWAKPRPTPREKGRSRFEN